jgi:broad specificity phosphatase PhoE
MAADVTTTDLARELGLHHETVRSRLREFFAERAEGSVREDLTRGEADEFLAWHATRYGAAG